MRRALCALFRENALIRLLLGEKMLKSGYDRIGLVRRASALEFCKRVLHLAFAMLRVRVRAW